MIKKGMVIVSEISLKPQLVKMLFCFSLQDRYVFSPLEFGKSYIW